jgi:hypothetical protein
METKEAKEKNEACERKNEGRETQVRKVNVREAIQPFACNTPIQAFLLLFHFPALSLSLSASFSLFLISLPVEIYTNLCLSLLSLYLSTYICLSFFLSLSSCLSSTAYQTVAKPCPT